MVVVWSQQHVFDHPWESIVAATWRKYPNPHNNSVVGLDILHRSFNTQSRSLESQRLIQTHSAIPKLASRLVGMHNPLLAVESSIVRPSERCMIQRTHNMSFTSTIRVDEKMVYRPHPEHPTEKTLLEQSAEITVHLPGVPFIESLERITAKTMQENAQLGRRAIDWVIGKLREEYTAIEQNITATLASAPTAASSGPRVARRNSTSSSTNSPSTSAATGLTSAVSFTSLAT